MRHFRGKLSGEKTEKIRILVELDLENIVNLGLIKFIICDTLYMEVKTMPTKNPRLNVVLDPSLYKRLNKLAQQEGISLSLAARDLIKEGLEIHEDMYWQEVARKREKTFSYKKSLSHRDVWK